MARDNLRPLIGISANLLAPDPTRNLYKGKELHYAERQMVEWVWAGGGQPLPIPLITSEGYEEELADRLDGLILSGGDDIGPPFYGEAARRPEWAGNLKRDRHEFALFHAFLRRDKPILGSCRGHQLINVALGGSMHQDLLEDGVVVKSHRDRGLYDGLLHGARILPGTLLSEVYGEREIRVNSVHHQAVRALGEDLVVAARSTDGVVESVWHPSFRFVLGVQWHPEWITPHFVSEGVLSADPLIRRFMQEARFVSEAS